MFESYPPPASASRPTTLTPRRRSLATYGGVGLLCVAAIVGGWRMAQWMSVYTTPILQPTIAENQTGRYLSARVATRAGNLNDALEYSRTALSLDPKNTTLARNAFHAALFSGNAKALETLAPGMVGDEKAGALAAMATATTTLQRGDYALAANQFSALPGRGLVAAFRSFFVAWAQVGQKNLKTPVVLPEFATENTDLQHMLQFQALLIENAAGLDASALKRAEALQQQSGQLPLRAVQGLAAFWQSHRAPEKAAALWDAFVKARPDMADLRPKTQDAVVATTPQQGAAELMYTIGTLVMGMQADLDALVHLNMALVLNPNHIPTQYALGLLNEKSKKPLLALAHYTAITPTDTLYYRTQLRIATIEHGRNNPTRAYAILDALQKQFPDDVDALLRFADFKRDDKDYSAAASAYTQALARRKAAPTEADWEIYYARGVAFERSQQWSKAEADFLQALRLKPDQPEVLNYLGYSWLTLGNNTEKAKQFIGQALQLQPENPAIIDSMGWVLVQEGSYEKARPFLEKAADLMPNDAVVNEHLGDVYWYLGMQDQAQHQWKRALLYELTETGQKERIEQKLQKGLPAPATAKPAAEPTEAH